MYGNRWRPGSSRPDYTPRLNPSNPLAKGCTYFAILNSGSPYNLVGQNFGSPVGTVACETGAHGKALSLTSGAGYVQIAGDADSIIPTARATIAFIRQKRDATARNVSIFGYNADAADRVMLSAPYGDGNLYWDFGNATGGAGGGRLAISGQTWDTRLDYLIAIAGPNKGREVWRNGVKIGSDATATASRPATVKGFTLGFNGDNGIGTDTEYLYYYAIIDAEWTDSQCASWFSNPYQLLAQPVSQIFGYDGDIAVSPSLGREIEQLEGGNASLVITPQVSSLKESEQLTGSLSLTIARSGTLSDAEQLLGAVSLVTQVSGVLKEAEHLVDGAISLPTSLSGSLIEAEQLPSGAPDFYDLLALSGFFHEIEQLPSASPGVTIGLSCAIAEAEQLPSSTLSGSIALSGVLAETERLGGYRAYIYIPLPVEGVLREIERCCGESPVIVTVKSERILIEFLSDSVLLEQAPDQVLVELIF